MARSRAYSETVRREPVPELVAEGDWTVQDTHPDFAEIQRPERLLHVPLGETQDDHLARLRQMGRLKWSRDWTPAEERMFCRSTLEAVEQARVQLLLDIHQPDWAVMNEDPSNEAQRKAKSRAEWCQRVGAEQAEAELLIRYAGRGPLLEYALTQASEPVRAMVRAGLDHLAEDPLDPNRVFTVAEMLYRLRFNARHQDDFLEIDSTGFGDKGFDREPGRGKWGTMTLTEPGRPFPAVPGRVGRRRRASDEGDIPRAMHRLTIDGRVFTRKVKEKGGTVLVDQSGSMNLSLQQLVAMAEAAPMITVAGYAGERGTGECRIVVKDGKRCRDDDMDVPYGGNIVDGPALRWLARQSRPLIWVSDGGVTGIGDRLHADLTDEAERLVKRHRIKVMPNAQTALEFFQSRRPK